MMVGEWWCCFISCGWRVIFRFVFVSRRTVCLRFGLMRVCLVLWFMKVMRKLFLLFLSFDGCGLICLLLMVF